MHNDRHPTEADLRDRLGIPADAQHVLVFAESSHWDPDWLYRSDEYFERFVEHNIAAAIDELGKDARRIYSIECMFFLAMYWEHHPEHREIIRNLANERRLRLTGSSVTTPDTLLPDAEAILRDYLIGQEWVRANGITQEPAVAYLPDSFGATSALPSVLRAAGFDRTAITRIDGMFFPGCDIELPRAFPKPGSSAERLLETERSLDFVWRDRNGAEVLCHWNAFTYGQGDMLASIGVSRVYLAPYALPRRTDRHVARRIARYVDRLAPVSRTPYLFCPIGFDFVEPIPDLGELLDRYNRNHYGDTGVWVVNAGIDDYLALVDTRRDTLPVIELDPNPYWTGFYSSRPSLKRRCRALVEDLLVAEKLSFLQGDAKTPSEVADGLTGAWWEAVVANHHDFITGTSPDRVVDEEQMPGLAAAAATVDAVIDRLAPEVPVATGPETIGDGPPAAESPTVAEGWELISYRDSGGLWRMGYEFAGGIWRESSRTRIETDAGLVELDGERVRYQIGAHDDSSMVGVRVEGKAPQGHTVTVRFATGVRPEAIIMDTPGGIIERPLSRRYDPTFWPLHRFVHLRDRSSGKGVAIFQTVPGAISVDGDGVVELVTFRNATREKIFGLIGIPGHPASGHERNPSVFEAVLFRTTGDWRDYDLARIASRVVWKGLGGEDRAILHDAAASLVSVDPPSVVVRAVKAASRGDGLIVRLVSLERVEGPVRIAVADVEPAAAFLCDARERDVEPLPISGRTVTVTMPGTIASVRIVAAFEL